MEHHIRCDAKEIARYVFVPGDHERARKIAGHLQDARLVTDTRGYLVFSGSYQGVFMTVCATGMGGPTVAIALEELAHMGANTFIRVGSCGVLQEGLTVGDVIITNGVIRFGGTSSDYMPLEFPAVPTFQVLQELVQASTELKIPTHVGLTVSVNSFYMPMHYGELAKAAGALGIEMESDTLFSASQYHGWRAGALFVSDGTATEIKPAWGADAFRQGEEKVIAIALQAMWKLAQASQH